VIGGFGSSVPDQAALVLKKELVADFVNRLNLWKLWEKTETCEVRTLGAYGPKNMAITRIPTPYAAMEFHHFFDRSALV
jgi:hypothetical protein